MAKAKHKYKTASKSATKSPGPSPLQKNSTSPLIFGKKNYLWVLGGLGLILLGLLLMSGGAMPSPDVWDDSIIYSFRRITLAPILILAGIIAQIVAIFK